MLPSDACTTEILAENGRKGYRELQQTALLGMALTGDKRVVKVIAAAGHAPDESPATQYPMGGDGPQWRLIKPRKFKIAMTVDGFGIARIPGFSTCLFGTVPYDSRARLARHIAKA